MGEKTYFPTLANQEEIKTKVGTPEDDALENPITLFGGVKSILGKFKNIWTAARAAKIDNLDATISSRAPANTALSNTVWTDARAAAIDAANNQTETNNTASKTGTLSQKNSYTIGLLENATFGLNALKNTITTNRDEDKYRYYPRASSTQTLSIVNKTLAVSAPGAYYSSPTITQMVLLAKFYPKCDGLVNIFADGTLSLSQTSNATGAQSRADLSIGISYADMGNSNILPRMEYRSNANYISGFYGFEHTWKLGDTVVSGVPVSCSQIQTLQVPGNSSTSNTGLHLAVEVKKGVPLLIWGRLSATAQIQNNTAPANTGNATGRITSVTLGCEYAKMI